jgi:hypothetical protein
MNSWLAMTPEAFAVEAEYRRTNLRRTWFLSRAARAAQDR